MRELGVYDFVLSAQFCCEHKTALKKSLFIRHGKISKKEQGNLFLIQGTKHILFNIRLTSSLVSISVVFKRVSLLAEKEARALETLILYKFQVFPR